MPLLDGLGVLVTRPRTQAMPLCRLLEEHGATAYRLPAIEIEPAASHRDLAARLGTLADGDLVIFTSANAVRYGAALLEQRRDLELVAIGPATARALNQAGYRVAIVPAGGFDSEHLLAEARLQHLAGRRVVLIKGGGGRDLLARELARRGAAVHPLVVYRRLPAVPAAQELARLEQLFATGAVQVVTATSVETGAALLGFATPALRAGLEAARWLVPGARTAAGLTALGLTARPIEAASAEDHDLVAALLRWRSSESGA
jgi:uroporphyrinogen-III synthase